MTDRSMIRRITLENYMAHAHTVIDLAEGLTVLVGPNNCGKSAVVAALETLCFNPGGDYMVRHGQRESRITVETADGHVLVWQRVGGSTSYLIDGREVGRLGRGGVPDDLHKLLRLPKVMPPDAKGIGDAFDVHFGYQKSPIFLLNESRGRQATFFASSSDAEKLLEMQRRHREKVADARRERAQIENDLALLDAQLAALAPLDELAPAVGRLETEHQAIQDQQAGITHLEQLIARLRECQTRQQQHRRKIETLASLQSPPVLHDTPALQAVAQRLSAAERRREQAQHQFQVLLELIPPPALHNTETLSLLIREFDKAGQLERRSEQSRDVLERLQPPPVLAEPAPVAELLARAGEVRQRADRHAKAIASIDRDLADVERQVAEWAQENPTCPVCGSPVQPQRILTGGHVHA